MKFIVAGNHNQAARYAQEQGMAYEDFKYVFGPHSLRGCPRGTEVLLVGTWEARTKRDLPGIYTNAKKYGYVIREG